MAAPALDIGNVRLTNPDKVLYPDQGITKRALAEYMLSVADRMLPHVARRPLTLVRCPQGRMQHCFYQRHHATGMPEGIAPVAIRARKDRQKAPYLMIEDATGLAALVQFGVLEIHIWGARADDVEHPDRLVFDLDPAEDVGFEVVRAAAVEMRDVLAAAELESFVLLTGGKGLHLVVPLVPEREWSEVKRFARGVATAMASEAPDRFVAKASKARRTGKIYIDWLRNDRSATAIAPFSTRARPNCPVAVPIAWRELPRVASGHQYTLTTLRRRLGSLQRDPWQNYFSLEQRIPDGALALFA
jgi:bifunctional non-homologous end joining protein LigD